MARTGLPRREWDSHLYLRSRALEYYECKSTEPLNAAPSIGSHALLNIGVLHASFPPIDDFFDRGQTDFC